MRGNDQETLALTDNCRDNSLLSFHVVSREERGGGGREDENACQCNLCPCVPLHVYGDHRTTDCHSGDMYFSSVSDTESMVEMSSELANCIKCFL